MSKAKSFLLGVISSQLYMLIILLVTLFSTPFILKKLDPEVYGLATIIFQIVSYLGILDFGLNSGVIRFLAASNNNAEETKIRISKIITTSFIAYFVLGGFVILIGSSMAPFISKVFLVPYIYKNSISYIFTLICICIGFQFLLRCISGIFFAHQMQFISHTLSFILSFSNLFFIILFVSLGYGLWSYVYAQFSVLIINSILSVILFRNYYSYVRLKISNFDKKLLREMLSFGFFIFINNIAVQVVFNTDRIVVGSIVSLASVSIYSLTIRLPELSTQLIWKVIDNSLPRIVELSKENNLDEFKNIHHKIMRFTLSLTCAVATTILIISFPFIKLWVGEKYYGGIILIEIVCYLYLIQHTYIHVTAVTLNGAGFVKGFSILSILEAILNLIFSIILGKKLGMIGIVLGTVIAGLLTSAWYVPYVAINYMKIKIIDYIKIILKPIAIYSLFATIIYFLVFKYFLEISKWTTFLGLSCILFSINLIPVFYLNKDLISIIKAKMLGIKKIN